MERRLAVTALLIVGLPVLILVALILPELASMIGVAGAAVAIGCWCWRVRTRWDPFLKARRLAGAVRGYQTQECVPANEETTMQPQTASTRIVHSSPGYQDAQRAVDFLSDNRFPVENVTIVGAGLKSVEQITGRRGYLQAAGGSALSGATVGLLLGWLFGLFNWVAPLISALVLAFWGLVIGLVIGAVVGLISHLATGGRRDFSSVSTVAAERYDVVVNAEVADEAQRQLDGMGGDAPEVPARRATETP